MGKKTTCSPQQGQPSGPSSRRQPAVPAVPGVSESVSDTGLTTKCQATKPRAENFHGTSLDVLREGNTPVQLPSKTVKSGVRCTLAGSPTCLVLNCSKGEERVKHLAINSGTQHTSMYAHGCLDSGISCMNSIIEFMNSILEFVVPWLGVYEYS